MLVGQQVKVIVRMHGHCRSTQFTPSKFMFQSCVMFWEAVCVCVHHTKKHAAWLSTQGILSLVASCAFQGVSIGVNVYPTCKA